jgi:hypothetical protein
VRWCSSARLRPRQKQVAWRRKKMRVSLGAFRDRGRVIAAPRTVTGASAISCSSKSGGHTECDRRERRRERAAQRAFHVGRSIVARVSGRTLPCRPSAPSVRSVPRGPGSYAENACPVRRSARGAGFRLYRVYNAPVPLPRPGATCRFTTPSLPSRARIRRPSAPLRSRIARPRSATRRAARTPAPANLGRARISENKLD